MARITTVDLVEARNRLKNRAADHDVRAPYREAIANLSDDRMLELEPDPGESLRALKTNVARAATDVKRLVDYGVSAEGTLLVWLRDKPKGKRGPRKSKAAPG